MSKPYLTPAGTLFIPFDADYRYRFWAGGQSILATLDELGAPGSVRNQYDPDIARDGGALGTRAQVALLVAAERRKELVTV